MPIYAPAPFQQSSSTTITPLSSGTTTLNGNAGGLTIRGGSAASDVLALHSTTNATRGNIVIGDDLSPVIVGGTSMPAGTAGSTANCLFGVANSKTYTAGENVTSLDLRQLPTFSTTTGGTLIGADMTVLPTENANMTLARSVYMQAGGGAGTTDRVVGLETFATQFAGGGTTTLSQALVVTTGAFAGTVTTGVGIDVVSGAFVGSTTTGIGLRMAAGTITGTTKWGFQIDDFQSYHVGKIALGGTTAPTYGIHLQSTTNDRGTIHLSKVTAVPTNPASSDGITMFSKGGQLCFGYNDAGTMRYLYISMTGTGVTWTHSTTAP